MKWSSVAPAAVLVAALIPTPARSDDAKHPMAEYRHVLMESLGRHMKASSMILRGQVDRKADLVMHAVALHDASKVVTDLFPAETAPDKTKSDSKPEVWTDWKRFVQLNEAFEKESARLVEVAKKGDLDAFKAQFAKVGGTCGDCHDAFRVDD